MKTCPKCGKDFPDLDNFCISCGARLKSKKLLASPTKETAVIHKRVKRLEKEIGKIPKSPKYVHILRKRMDNLEHKVGNTATSLKTSLKEVDKKAQRIGQLKFMPNQDALSIAQEVGVLEKKIDELNNSISGLRLEMPKAEHILVEIEQRIGQTKGALFTKQQHELDEMIKKIGLIESRVEGTERDVEESIEKIKKETGVSEIGRFLNNVNENRKKIEELQLMKKDFNEIKKRSESFNAQEIKENIITDFEKINNNLVESVEQKKSEIQRIEHETAQMREGIESLKGLEQRIGKVNAEGITRDLEILKTKTKWLEEQIEGLDIKPLHERIHELETDLRRIISSSPLVVE
jgi:DNA repair exonuclease SbcCD ATPase subunit